MARLALGRPLSQAHPTLMVDNALPPGRHRFRLVVTDKAGNDSAPDEIVITVRPVPPRHERAGERR